MEEFVLGAVVALASALIGLLGESWLQGRRERRRTHAAAKLLLMELGDLRSYVERVLQVNTEAFEAITVVRPDSVERSIWEAHRHQIVEAADEDTVRALAHVYGRCFETIKSAGTVGAKLAQNETGISEDELLGECIEAIKVAESRLRRDLA